MFTSEAYTPQNNTTIDKKIITSGESVLIAQYLCSIQVETNWYLNQQLQQYVITVPTRTVLHTQTEVIVVTYFHEIPKSLCTRKKGKKTISRPPICLTDS